METKACYGCNTQKPLTDFHKHSGKKGGLQSRCKICRNNNRNYSSDKAREWHLKRAYNMTVEDYNLMLFNQNSLCPICGNEAYESFHIDHDHETGEVRGLLCANCNQGLGNFKDSINNLINAINYLKG